MNHLIAIAKIARMLILRRTLMLIVSVCTFMIGVILTQGFPDAWRHPFM